MMIVLLQRVAFAICIHDDDDDLCEATFKKHLKTFLFHVAFN